MRRELTALTALTAGMLAAALPAVVWGAFAWSLVVSPQTATQGQSTVFSLTLNNQGSSKIGCFEIDLPASFVILSLGDPNASNGEDWDSTRNGNTVEVEADGGGAELEQGESVTFTITARPNAAGPFAWTNQVHQKQDCKKKKDAGPPLQVTVVPSGPPPPPPAPTPGATAVPTARPASTPTTASPTPTAEPSPTPEASSSERISTPAPAPSPGGTGTGGPGTLQLAPPSDSADGTTSDLGTGLDILAMLDGPFVWFVPGAAVGVPGLLVIAFVVLQALGAMAWIPATRRLGGDDQPIQRRPPRPA